jgi:hypothetical protein
LDTGLDLVTGLRKPVVLCALSKGNGSLLKTIKLIKLSTIRNIANKMKAIIIVFGCSIILFNGKWILPGEAIMDLSNQV